MCLYVCDGVCEHVCLYVCDGVCEHVCLYVCDGVCDGVCVCVCVAAFVYTYKCTHMHVSIFDVLSLSD